MLLKTNSPHLIIILCGLIFIAFSGCSNNRRKTETNTGIGLQSNRLSKSKDSITFKNPLNNDTLQAIANNNDVPIPFDLYSSTIPSLNIYARRVITTKDTIALNVLRKQIPGVYYKVEWGMGSSDWVIAWKSATNSVNKLTDNWVHDHWYTPFEQSNTYFSSLLGSVDFKLKDFDYKLIAFNTSSDEHNAGHYTGGVQGLVILKFIDSIWQTEYYNPAIGAYGSWQSSSMPDITVIKDSMLLLENHNGFCSPGGPCSSNEEILVYQNHSISRIGWIEHLLYYKQRPGSHWESNITYSDSLGLLEINTRGYFCPSCENDVSEVPSGLETPWWVYNHFGKKPFEFSWKRELRLNNGKWKFTDSGCRALRWVNEDRCCKGDSYYNFK